MPRDEIFHLPSAVVKLNTAASTLVLRKYILYLPESKAAAEQLKERDSKMSAMFFMCLHPFIFLELLGFVNEETTRNQARKDLDSKKVLMREPF